MAMASGKLATEVHKGMREPASMSLGGTSKQSLAAGRHCLDDIRQNHLQNLTNCAPQPVTGLKGCPARQRGLLLEHVGARWHLELESRGWQGRLGLQPG